MILAFVLSADSSLFILLQNKFSQYQQNDKQLDSDFVLRDN